MDSRQFDLLTRSIAGTISRRSALRRGLALGGALGSLALIEPASAARRGTNGGTTLICNPDGAGGYYKLAVATVTLNAYLNKGAIVSSCCGDAECGESNGCMQNYCDFGAGACAVAYYDGSDCDRPGCVPGQCVQGVCDAPEPAYYMENNFCQDCDYDSCRDAWSCRMTPCYDFDHQCTSAYCDPVQAACVQQPINEGSNCNTYGENGICVNGHCSAGGTA